MEWLPSCRTRSSRRRNERHRSRKHLNLYNKTKVFGGIFSNQTKQPIQPPRNDFERALSIIAGYKIKKDFKTAEAATRELLKKLRYSEEDYRSALEEFTQIGLSTEHGSDGSAEENSARVREVLETI